MPRGAEARRQVNSGLQASGAIGAARLIVFSQVMAGSFAAVALFGYLWLNIAGDRRLIALFAAIVAATLTIARLRGDAILASLRKAGRFVPGASPTLWFFSAIALGVALRIAAVEAFPAAYTSDAATYFELAHRLAGGLDYAAPQGRAYWPPGLPLLLAALMIAFGRGAVMAYNLGTFVVAEIAMFMLARMLTSWQVACSAAFLLAIWPNYVFASAFLLKECLLVALWPVAVYCYLRAHRVGSDSRAGGYALVAGGSIGYASLTQPATILMPICLALFSVLTAGWGRRTYVCVLAAGLGVVLVITPWAVRDSMVVHHFAPLGTAGGVNFYMVTRPQSDGRWNLKGAQEAEALSSDEVVRNRRGYRLGLESILHHPLRYLSTVIMKPFYIFGEDVNDTYWVFVRGKVGTAGEYTLFYLLSNGFYLVMIVLISLFALSRQYAQIAPVELILPWMVTLYPILSNSLFEASERYRYGAMPFMAIFAAMAICRAPGLSQENPSHSPIMTAPS